MAVNGTSLHNIPDGWTAMRFRSEALKGFGNEIFSSQMKSRSSTRFERSEKNDRNYLISSFNIRNVAFQIFLIFLYKTFNIHFVPVQGSGDGVEALILTCFK